MSALDTSSEERIEADLRAVEYELRADGRLAFATCEALRSDARFAGLEPALRFLRCTVFAADPDTPALPRRRRVQACRLMLLSLGAHTPAPRWTVLEIEQLVESAMAIAGAELSDLAQAQFALLGETTANITAAQESFLRELGRQIADKRRLGHSAEDFVWIAVRLADPLPTTSAQAFFAAHTLPPQ
ncbi:MAG: hypothetical protein H0T65_04235, partial [Deltaproteobacteria bacterium]|nr:hypothetical protein [Deltaproteobacteria bacterium]